MFRGLNRGGVRGGKDQFNWEDVKNDKDRENYLGHSLKVSSWAHCCCLVERTLLVYRASCVGYV